MNVHRLSNATQQGPKRCLMQHNILEGNVKSTKDMRKEILSETKHYVNQKILMT